ncbi:unnamed protein product [Mytilus edulis]|uniref:Uncharacterized protein n=1 Tax=Mytilus edulis TaxID=6550 RepID=A0A8S3VJE9_MYTED|nr:unnamed protein product [Mytilus edulis]
MNQRPNEKQILHGYNAQNEPKKGEVASDQTSVKYNLPVSVVLRLKFNIKETANENQFITSCIKTGNTLVFTEQNHERLIICNSDGTDIHHIHLSYKPCYMTEMDSNIVAVTCHRMILIINISTRSVISKINTNDNCYGISYNDDNLYVVIDKFKIHVMDMTGKVKRTMLAPSGLIHDITVDRNRLVCIDYTSSIYCCSLDGTLMWKLKMDKFQYLRRVTTDDEGNVYVTNESTHNVIVVSYDGKHHSELLTESDGLNNPYGIYFDKKENILLVSNDFDGKIILFDVNKK